MTTTDSNVRTWAAMNGAGFARYELPPRDALPAPVAKAVGVYENLLAKWKEAAAQLNSVDTRPARAAAERADRDAYAAAIAKGAADPGEPALRKYEAGVRAAVRRKAASAKAVDTAASELRAAVAANRDALDKLAGERLAAAEAAWLAHVDAFPAIALELAEARRVASWHANIETRQPWGRPLPLPSVATIAANGITSEKLARVLHEVVAPVDLEPSDPLHIDATVTGKALAEAGPVPDEVAA